MFHNIQHNALDSDNLTIIDEFHPHEIKTAFYEKLIFNIKSTINRLESEFSSKLKESKHILKNNNIFYGAIRLYNTDELSVVTYHEPVDLFISNSGTPYIDGFSIRIFNINFLYKNINFESLLNDLPDRDFNLKEFYSDIPENSLYAINGKLDYYRVLELLFEYIKEKIYLSRKPEFKHNSYFTEQYNTFDVYYDIIKNTDNVKEMLINRFIFELLSLSDTHIRINNFDTYKYIESYISSGIKSLNLYSNDAWMYVKHYSTINNDILYETSYKNDIKLYKKKFIELCKKNRKIIMNELLNIFNNFEQIYNIIYKQNNDFIQRLYKRAFALGVEGYRAL